MTGPKSSGRRSGRTQPAPFRHRTPGAGYEVRRGFADRDGDTRPPAEAWLRPGHDVLLRAVGVLSRDMRWDAEAMGAIVGDLASYVHPAAAGAGKDRTP